MNKQGNTYTFLYSVVLVVVVAALLSIVSLSLQPRQNENRENEKRKNILSAIHISSTAENSAELFGKYIKEQFIVNTQGEKIEGNAFNVNIKAVQPAGRKTGASCIRSRCRWSHQIHPADLRSRSLGSHLGIYLPG
ncbi:MAG: hypothetical protein V8S95_08170 [Odoribacter sp.]